MTKTLILSLGLVLLLLTAAAAEKIDMQDGLWQITTVTEMPGVPFEIPPMTFNQCITQQELVPQLEQPGGDCILSDTQISGNTVTWSVVCKGEGGSSRGDGKVTYQGDRFEGDMTMSMDGGMQMNNHMKGIRLGACQ